MGELTPFGSMVLLVVSLFLNWVPMGLSRLMICSHSPHALVLSDEASSSIVQAVHNTIKNTESNLLDRVGRGSSASTNTPALILSYSQGFLTDQPKVATFFCEAYEELQRSGSTGVTLSRYLHRWLIDVSYQWQWAGASTEQIQILGLQILMHLAENHLVRGSETLIARQLLESLRATDPVLMSSPFADLSPVDHLSLLKRAGLPVSLDLEWAHVEGFLTARPYFYLKRFGLSSNSDLNQLGIQWQGNPFLIDTLVGAENHWEALNRRDLTPESQAALDLAIYQMRRMTFPQQSIPLPSWLAPTAEGIHKSPPIGPLSIPSFTRWLPDEFSIHELLDSISSADQSPSLTPDQEVALLNRMIPLIDSHNRPSIDSMASLLRKFINLELKSSQARAYKAQLLFKTTEALWFSMAMHPGQSGQPTDATSLTALLVQSLEQIGSLISDPSNRHLSAFLPDWIEFTNLFCRESRNPTSLAALGNDPRSFHQALGHLMADLGELTLRGPMISQHTYRASLRWESLILDHFTQAVDTSSQPQQELPLWRVFPETYRSAERSQVEARLLSVLGRLTLRHPEKSLAANSPVREDQRFQMAFLQEFIRAVSEEGLKESPAFEPNLELLLKSFFDLLPRAFFILSQTQEALLGDLPIPSHFLSELSRAFMQVPLSSRQRIRLNNFILETATRRNDLSTEETLAVGDALIGTFSQALLRTHTSERPYENTYFISSVLLKPLLETWASRASDPNNTGLEARVLGTLLVAASFEDPGTKYLKIALSEALRGLDSQSALKFQVTAFLRKASSFLLQPLTDKTMAQLLNISSPASTDCDNALKRAHNRAREAHSLAQMWQEASRAYRSLQHPSASPSTQQGTPNPQP